MPSSSSDLPGGLCVLVVEDDEADAYLICRALSANPSVERVVRALDGVEALRMVEQGEVAPDLAFIDLQMPRKGGFSLLTAFAERSASAFPMVVLTSSTAPVDAMRSRLRGAIRVVSKPATTDALESELAFAVNAACRGRALPQFECRTFKASFRGVPATQHLIALEEDRDPQWTGPVP